MSDTAANVGVLKKAYHRSHESKGRDVDHWLGIVEDDIKFGSLAEGADPIAFARDYDGRQALRRYFDGLLADWEMIRYTVDKFVADGDAVFARGSRAWKNKRTGKIADTPKVDFWHFRNGKAVEFYEYYDTMRVIAAAT